MSASSKRILLNTAIFISIIFFPWWLTALLAIAGIIIFNWFYEALLAGFLMDSLYGVPTSFFYGFTFVATLTSAMILAAVMYIKPKLR